MELFKTTKQFFAMIGITQEKMLHTYPINCRLFMSFLAFFTLFLFTLLYMVFDADSFLEYVQCSYFCSASLMAIVDLTLLVLEGDQVFINMANMEQIIETSELDFLRAKLFRTVS